MTPEQVEREHQIWGHSLWYDSGLFLSNEMRRCKIDSYSLYLKGTAFFVDSVAVDTSWGSPIFAPLLIGTVTYSMRIYSLELRWDTSINILQRLTGIFQHALDHRRSAHRNQDDSQEHTGWISIPRCLYLAAQHRCHWPASFQMRRRAYLIQEHNRRSESADYGRLVMQVVRSQSAQHRS